MVNKKFIMKKIIALFMLFIIALPNVLAFENTAIKLDGVNDEVIATDNDKLDGLSRATWNMWVKQEEYKNYAGILGKYKPESGKRSFLIRTVLTNSVSIVLSEDGSSTQIHASSSEKKCGIKNNNEWTMITITFDGEKKEIKYYRNGILCDIDKTSINKIYNSPESVRFGGGNNVFFKGMIDYYRFYSKALPEHQIKRIYDESRLGGHKGTSIPLIVYHNIEEIADDSGKVSMKKFEDQMNFLKSNGFKAITVNDYNKWRKGQFTMPNRPVIIIFDDGRISVYKNALPIMEKYNIKGTIMVVSDYANRISGGSSYMHWPELKELKNKGWGMDSHGVSHIDMLSLNEEEFRKQLEISKINITENLDVTPTSFTFPFHRSSQIFGEVCGEYYDLCWTWGNEPENPEYSFKNTDPKDYRSLKRIMIRNSTMIGTFKEIFGMDLNINGEWKMNENTGETTVDSSGNNNHARLINGATWIKETVN